MANYVIPVYVSFRPATGKPEIARVGELNRMRGKSYPEIGWLHFADIKGDGGSYRPRVYAIINAQGGVAYSELNGRNYLFTLHNLKTAIEKESSHV